MSNYFVGEIPLNAYISHLIFRRDFNKELTIEYTKEIYKIDLTNILDEYNYLFLNSTNIYDLYEKKFPRTKPDDGTRKYFQSIGRKYFNNFMNYHGNNNREDIFNSFCKKCDVHHIHPLSISEDNSLLNLVYLCNFNHKLLHKNPLDGIKEYCFKAFDYLGYLYSSSDVLIEKYQIQNYKDNMDFAVKIYNSALEKEMDEFYKRMVNEYGMVTV